MKSRKPVWIAALCLCSAIAIAVAFTAHTTHVQAAKHVVQVQGKRTTIAQPAVYLASPALRNAMLAESTAPIRVSVTPQRGYNPSLPEVEEFTLTPPNPEKGMTKTTLRVSFPQGAAEKLASQVPFTLGDQNVVLQRSADNPSEFVTQVDFDWQSFAKVQQQRKDLAETGRVIPVFQGRRLLRMDKIEFIDPAEVLGALPSHQSIHFTPQILEETDFTIDPQTELMITDPNVVEDPNRTFDPCPNGQPGTTQMGAWTFGRLMLSISGQTDATNITNIESADTMVHNLLEFWANDQTGMHAINSFSVLRRPGIGQVMSASTWPLDPGGVNNDIRVAPFQLNAIVNRMDIGEGSSPLNAGELRLVFGYAPCASNGDDGQGLNFNVIFEYNVPTAVASGCTGNKSVQAWADLWQNVENDFEACEPNGAFREVCQASDQNPNPIADIQIITDKVITVSAGGQFNLAAFRSNENVLNQNQGGPNEDWELRQFGLTGLGGSAPPSFVEVPLFETPEGSPLTSVDGQPMPNFGLNYVPGEGNLICIDQQSGQNCEANVLEAFINQNQSSIDFPGTYQVPAMFGSGITGQQPFQGASAFQAGSPGAFWNASGISNNTTRMEFSENTCNGCHGAEVQTSFKQVEVRHPLPLNQNPQPSPLSAFLVGCSFCNGSSCPGGALTSPCVPPANACNLQNTLSQNGACPQPPSEVVQDPAMGSGHNNTIPGDLSRRATYMMGVLGGNCQGDQLLRGVLQHRPSFSH